MHATGAFSFGRLLLAVVGCLIAGLASGQDDVNWMDAGSSPSPNAFPLAFGTNRDDILTLMDRRPVRRSLRPGEPYSLQFAVQEVDQMLPDMLLSVREVGGTGDVDLYCSPLEDASHASLLPGPYNYVWHSNHTSGTDYVFASREHPEYTVKKLTLNDGERAVRGAALTCAVVGARYADPNSSLDFELRLELSYRRWSNVRIERRAMESMFRKCCKDEKSCVPWRHVRGDMCHLMGSVCNSDGFLVRLSLPHFGLDCDFPIKEIAQLSQLEKLELGWNNISGDINEIAQKLVLKGIRLQHLGVRDNRLVSQQSGNGANTGAVELCRLVQKQLSFIDLRNNKVNFTVPPCLFSSSSSLEELYLGGNPLTGMRLPRGFPSESRIRVIDMSSAGLTRMLPKSLGTAPRLRSLDLSGNNLTGRIPKALGQAPMLEFLNLGRNQLVGKIPNSFADSASLKVLWLNDNLLTGLPNQWNGNMEASEALVDVVLAGNQIRSQFPVSLAKAKNLLRLHIGDNLMKGELPRQSLLFPHAVHLHLDNNLFEGSIPPQWSTLGMFAFLNGISDSMTFTRRDTNESIPLVLDISNNDLSGEPPRFLVDAYMSKQAQVYLGGNTGLSCLSLVNQSCEQFFVKTANNPDYSSRRDLSRVDALYAEQPRDGRQGESGDLGDTDVPVGLGDALPIQSSSSGLPQPQTEPRFVVSSQNPGTASNPGRGASSSEPPLDVYFWVLVAIGIGIGGTVCGAVIAVLVWRMRKSSTSPKVLRSRGSDVCCLLQWRGTPSLTGGSASVPKPPPSANIGSLDKSASRPPVVQAARYPGVIPSGEQYPPHTTGSLSWSSSHDGQTSPTTISTDRGSMSNRPWAPVMGTSGGLPAMRAGGMPLPLRSGISGLELRGNAALPTIKVHKGHSRKVPTSVDPMAASPNRPGQPPATVTNSDSPEPPSDCSSKHQSSGCDSAGSVSHMAEVGVLSPSLNGWLAVTHSPSSCSGTSTDLPK